MNTEFFLFGMVRAAVAGALRNKLVMEENMVVAMSLHTGKDGDGKSRGVGQKVCPNVYRSVKSSTVDFFSFWELADSATARAWFLRIPTHFHT